MKNSAAQDRALLKKSSLNIPLVSETAEDRKMAKLLSKKFETANATETTESIRQKIISSACLPSSFSVSKEKKALRVLSEGKLSNLVKRKNETDKEKQNDEQKIEEMGENKKIKLTSLVGDYGSGTDSD